MQLLRNIRRATAAAATAIAGGIAMGEASAIVPQTAPDRFIDVEIAAAPAREIAFLLSYALAPLCDEKQQGWSAGVPPAIVSTRSTSESAMTLSRLLQERFGAAPGQAVFIGDQTRTPYGVAGIRAGDLLDTPLMRSTEAAKSRDEEWTPVPNSAVLEGGSASQTSAGELIERLRAASEAAYSRDPVRKLTALRAAERIPLAVRMVKVCTVYVQAIDSRYFYADSDNRFVYISLPLLNDLAPEELAVVVAHEVAHVVLGLSDGRVSGKLAAKIFLGRLAGIGENVETETSAPKDVQLIQADRLALRMAIAMNIEPDAYLGALRRLVSREESWGRPDYPRTRPLTPKRLEALENSVKLWKEKKRYFPPGGVPLEKVREAFSRLSRVWKNPGTAFAATQATPAPAATVSAPPTLQHARRMPEESGFASIDDAGAVPVREEGKPRYQHFLTLPKPRAFVVSENGGWRFWWRDANAMTKALEYCEKLGRACALYAVDDRVVWQPDPERRVSRVEQLEKLPPE